MGRNYTLKYRTFDSLVDECMIDFKKYQDNGLIEPQELIKVAKRCNYELGLRIYKTKEIVIDISHGRGKLPNDFYVLNFAMALGHGEYKQHIPQGTHVEEVFTDDYLKYNMMPKDPTPCKTCVKVPCSCKMNKCGDKYYLEQTFKTQTFVWDEFFPLNILTETEDFNGLCPGKYWQSDNSATIKNGWLYTSFQNGKVYINYSGDMEDEDGNLLIPDHDLLNDYYEYALKQRILENIIMNDEEQNTSTLNTKMQIIEKRYKDARANAMSFVNTPNFNELKELFVAIRNSTYNRFYAMFASHPNFKRI